MQFKISLIALIAGTAFAQQRPRCGTGEPTEAQLEVAHEMGLREAALRQSGLSARQSGTITVDTWFHVVSAGSSVAQGNVSEQQLADQLEVLNAQYAPYGVSFNLVGTTRTVNSGWADDSNQLAMKRSLRKGDYKTMNVYFQRSLEFNALGYAYFPDNVSEGSQDFYLDGVSVMASSVPGGSEEPYNLGVTATHEAGHWLGLYHPFQGGCTGVGDEIDDTPAQSGYEFGCPVGRDSCPNDPGDDPVHNYMGYSDDACLTEFTPNQETRIHNMWARFRA